MKKILFVTNDIGGLYRFRKELINSLLNEKNKEIYISSPYGIYSDYFSDLGCKLIVYNYNRKGKNPFRDFLLFTHYLKTIKKIKPNLVIAYTLKPNIYSSLASRFTRTKCFANVTGLGEIFEKKTIISFLIKKLLKISLRKNEISFFQNESDLDFFTNLKIIDKEKAILVPGSGVNLIQHPYQEFPKNEIIKIIYIGRISDLKGFDLFLGLAKYFKEISNELEFHVLGSVEDKKYEILIQEYEKSGYIINHGFKENVSEYLKVSRLLVNTSLSEGMSNVVLEAHAAGRPAIAADIPGCRDIIEDGKSGFLFKKGNLESLIKSVKSFCELSIEQQKEMGMYGREIIEKKFDRNYVISIYLDKINFILQENDI